MPTIKAQTVMANSIALPLPSRAKYPLPQRGRDSQSTDLHFQNISIPEHAEFFAAERGPTTIPHCTLCNLLINFCARFSSDSDHSRRVSAPTLFSTRLM